MTTTTSTRIAYMTEQQGRPAIHGGTVREAALAHAADLLADVAAGTVSAEDSAGDATYRAVQFTLAGGGPGYDVTILLDEDDEPREGWFTYYDGGVASAVHLAPMDAADVYAALTAPPADS